MDMSRPDDFLRLLRQNPAYFLETVLELPMSEYFVWEWEVPKNSGHIEKAAMKSYRNDDGSMLLIPSPLVQKNVALLRYWTVEVDDIGGKSPLEAEPKNVVNL